MLIHSESKWELGHAKLIMSSWMVCIWSWSEAIHGFLAGVSFYFRRWSHLIHHFSGWNHQVCFWNLLDWRLKDKCETWCRCTHWPAELHVGCAWWKVLALICLAASLCIWNFTSERAGRVASGSGTMDQTFFCHIRLTIFVLVSHLFVFEILDTPEIHLLSQGSFQQVPRGWTISWPTHKPCSRFASLRHVSLQ